MPRLRLYDFRVSTGPTTLGICQSDLPTCAAYVNSAQRRLVLAKEAGDEGWWGTWAEVAFSNVSRHNPYITCGRDIARLEKIDICNRPVRVQNQFYEYLDFGNGRMPSRWNHHHRGWQLTEAMTRNNTVTFADQSVSPCILRVFAGDSADINAAKRVLLQGTDSSGTPITSQDGLVQVEGIFVTLSSPFAQAPIQFATITGLQKDQTAGPVQIFQVDPATNNQTLLVTMQPTETVAGYRRYYLNQLPPNCCFIHNLNQSVPQPLTVTALAKLELISVQADTDYLLLQNLEAIIEECIAIRMSRMDNPQSQQLAAIHHINAVRLLGAELVHYLGKNNPAVQFSPFGSAKLEHQQIGNML